MAPPYREPTFRCSFASYIEAKEQRKLSGEAEEAGALDRAGDDLVGAGDLAAAHQHPAGDDVVSTTEPVAA